MKHFLFQGADDDEGTIRAPIIPTRETMIDATTDNFRIRRRNLAAQNVVPLRNFQIEAGQNLKILGNGRTSC